VSYRVEKTVMKIVWFVVMAGVALGLPFAASAQQGGIARRQQILTTRSPNRIRDVGVQGRGCPAFGRRYLVRCDTESAGRRFPCRGRKCSPTKKIEPWAPRRQEIASRLGSFSKKQYVSQVAAALAPAGTRRESICPVPARRWVGASLRRPDAFLSILLESFPAKIRDRAFGLATWRAGENNVMSERSASGDRRCRGGVIEDSTRS